MKLELNKEAKRYLIALALSVVSAGISVGAGTAYAASGNLNGALAQAPAFILNAALAWLWCLRISNHMQEGDE